MTPRVTQQARKHYVIILTSLLFLVVASSAAIYYYRLESANAVLPREAYQNLTFPVYFPENPPQGFVLDTSSISSRQNVLTYKYDYAGSRPVAVSIQPVDSQLDTTSFKPTREFTTDIGKAYLVEFDDRTTIAITTAKSLVLINAPEKIPSAEMELFATSLKLLN